MQMLSRFLIPEFDVNIVKIRLRTQQVLFRMKKLEMDKKTFKGELRQ